MGIVPSDPLRPVAEPAGVRRVEPEADREGRARDHEKPKDGKRRQTTDEQDDAVVLSDEYLGELTDDSIPADDDAPEGDHPSEPAHVNIEA